MSREEDTLQKQFVAKQLVWPARYSIYPFF